MPDPILADIDRRLERIENGIFGNGREGLIQGVARLDERVASSEERIEQIEISRNTWVSRFYSMALTIGVIVYGFFDQR
tara:strand:+ start:718 stop:954 length:237 start_codon:yes stop_codon:yes gene_type:complete